MGCRTLFINGLDIDIYIAGNVAKYSATWVMVYFGRWFVVQLGGYILSVAEIKVFTCNLAFVCDWRNGLFFLCGSLWRDSGRLCKLNLKMPGLFDLVGI